MTFSLPMFGVTFAAVAVSAGIAALEGNFRGRHVTMSFVRHGGMWGDLLLMAPVAGLAGPFLIARPIRITACAAASVALTLLAHRLWGDAMRQENVTGHMFPSHLTGRWHRDLSWAGRFHLLVMAWLLALTMLYVLSPVPRPVALAVTILLSVHILVGALLPCRCCGGDVLAWRNVGPPLVLVVLTILVGALKSGR